jgi:integrase
MPPTNDLKFDWKCLITSSEHNRDATMVANVTKRGDVLDLEIPAENVTEKASRDTVSHFTTPGQKERSDDLNASLDVHRQRRALHHLIVVQDISEMPGLAVPVLYLAEPDGEGGETLRPLETLTDFFIAHSAMSLTWMRDRARGLGVLFDYLRQRRSYFDEVARDPFFDVHGIVFSQFQNHLIAGTVIFGPEGVRDDNGLFWLPSASRNNAVGLIRGIRDFVLWVSGDGHPGYRADSLLRSPFPETGHDTVRFLRAAKHKQDKSFLAHLKPLRRQRQVVGSAIVGRDTRGDGIPDNVQFPREFLGRLISEGFMVRKGRAGDIHEDVTAKLATMLCAFGGLRMSEPLHLWVQDIQRVNGEPVVFLKHPVRARVDHPLFGRMDRKSYLRQVCGMEPRTQIAGRLHAGWKGIKCNNEFWAPLYWLPFPGMTDLFMETFQSYLFNIRPELMRKRADRGLPDHPFLLVSAGRSNQAREMDSTGDPYTKVGFENAWVRAMARLRKLSGNDPRLEVEKRRGTTLHGLRHLYGGILAELGMSPEVIQQCMHHLSPLSQQTYTKPRNQFVSDQLNAAMKVKETATAPAHKTLSEAFGIYTLTPRAN